MAFGVFRLYSSSQMENWSDRKTPQTAQLYNSTLMELGCLSLHAHNLQGLIVGSVVEAAKASKQQ
jgi:hypothetical protein